MKSHWMYFVGALFVAAMITFGVNFVRQKLRMRELARDLGMESRIFYELGQSIEGPIQVPGTERILVVGKSRENYLLCSVVRHTHQNDLRAMWKVDLCMRPDLNPQYPRTPIWEPLQDWPTDSQIARFMQLATKQKWIVWDTPEGRVALAGR